jgi:hypothetical protein
MSPSLVYDPPETTQRGAGAADNRLKTMEKHGNRSVNDVSKMRGRRGFHL